MKSVAFSEILLMIFNQQVDMRFVLALVDKNEVAPPGKRLNVRLPISSDGSQPSDNIARAEGIWVRVVVGHCAGSVRLYRWR
jgi:hypothetical protein